MPIMEISIVPVGTRRPSVSHYVAKVLKIVAKQKGVHYELTAMGTIIQAASLKTLFNLAQKMHKAMLTLGVKRVVTTIKIDDRTDKRLTMRGKINSVQTKVRN